IIGFFRSRGIFNSTSIESVVNQAMYRSRYNVVKMMILISLLFCVSWMPYFVLLLIEKITGTSDVTDAESSVQMLRLALAVFSTVYNFLLNIIYNRNFRGGFQKFFVCARRVARTNTIVPLEPGNTANLAGSSDIMVTPSAFVLSLQPRSATLA
ncbi:neuropeptide FF receptor 2, partial [Biomphalaria glabrata]